MWVVVGLADPVDNQFQQVHVIAGWYDQANLGWIFGQRIEHAVTVLIHAGGDRGLDPAPLQMLGDGLSGGVQSIGFLFLAGGDRALDRAPVVKHEGNVPDPFGR